MTHPVRPSKEITGVQCATCRVVRGVERVETHADTTTFTLACGHTVTLQPGTECGMHVTADSIIVYPNRADLPARQGDV
jgi:hypothetical protein